jgi:hypothetical protein
LTEKTRHCDDQVVISGWLQKLRLVVDSALIGFVNFCDESPN